MKIRKKHLRQISYWAIFILASVAMAVKIADASAKESLKLFLDNPECAQYSDLVIHWYFREQ